MKRLLGLKRPEPLAERVNLAAQRGYMIGKAGNHRDVEPERIPEAKDRIVLVAALGQPVSTGPALLLFPDGSQQVVNVVHKSPTLSAVGTPKASGAAGLSGPAAPAGGAS